MNHFEKEKHGGRILILIIYIFLSTWASGLPGRLESGASSEWGHPLKVGSREKTPPRCKKYTFFAWPLMDSQQHGLVFASFRIRYFFFIGFRSHTDPHQSLSEA